MEFQIIRWGTALAVLGLVCAAPAQAQEGMEDLAKAAQNPIASMISLPFQNNTNLNFGPQKGTQNVLNVQPVYPFNLSEDMKVITRTIIPIVSQPALVPGQDRESGIGNTTFVPYFTPSKTGKVLWGVAPVLMLPASNASVGSKAWGLGASAVLLAMPGKWVVGSTITNVSSVNADPADKLNLFTWQYFINYNFPSGWYLTSSPIITANLEASSGNKWTIPFGGGFGKIFKIGKRPVNLTFQYYKNVETPDFGADSQFRLAFTLLYPTG